MDRVEAIEQIRVVVGKVLNTDVPTLDSDTRLLEELGVDSTGILEILVELEDRSGLEINVDELEPSVFESAGSLADYIVAMAPVD